MLEYLLEHDLNDIRDAIAGLPTHTDTETDEQKEMCGCGNSMICEDTVTTITLDLSSRHALAELAERIHAIVDHAYARKAIADVHTTIRANNPK